MAVAFEVFNSASGSNVNTLGIALNTSGTNRIALIAVTTSDVGSGIPQVTSVTGAGLTWAKYNDFDVTTDGHRIELWWAYAAAQITAQTITVNTDVNSRGLGLVVFAASGVPASRYTDPWDNDPSMPAEAQNPSATPASNTAQFSTHDNTGGAILVWGANQTSVNNTSTPSGWTAQISLDFNGSGSVAQKLRVFTKVFSSQIVNETPDFGSVVHWGTSIQALGGNIIFPHSQSVSAGF